MVLGRSRRRHRDDLAQRAEGAQVAGPDDDVRVDEAAGAAILEALGEENKGRLPGNEDSDGETENGPEIEIALPREFFKH